MNPCQCGCGELAKNRFVFGHHRRRDPIVRFWKFTDKRPDSECWPWRGRIDRLGYGVFYDRFKCINAHRVSYAIHYGQIAAGQHVLHTCDNRRCVNPNHLALGTHHDNMIDMALKGRANRKLTHSDVIAIRASTEPQSALARRYGVNPSTISKTKSGQRRQYVMPETWVAVRGYESTYQVSDWGRLRRIGRKIRKTQLNGGYLSANLSQQHVIIKRPIHQLIAEAFLGPRPAGLLVNHKDGNKFNNRPSNLEWVTPAYNNQHAYDVCDKGSKMRQRRHA